ncbi:hypothetical protein AAC387_Pa07g2559 [Persea americana]
MSFFLWKDIIKLGAPGAISQPLRSNGVIEHSRSLEDFCRERLIRVWSVKGAASTDFWSVRDQWILKKKKRNAAASNRSSWCDSSTDFLKSSKSNKERSSGVLVEETLIA